MKNSPPASGPISLVIPKSSVPTTVNKTGTWRFVRPVYDAKTAPCSAACPAGQDIPRIEMLAGRGRFLEAASTILMENPFPAVCGRVCFHPCETRCNRASHDAAVSINRLERFAGDAALAKAPTLPKAASEKSGKKICIAGAGPAGLSAAWFLTLLGHRCTVFEAESEPGGVMRWGIPEYRLPGAILKAEIDRIASLGVEIRTGEKADPSVLNGGDPNFDAAFIACGFGRSTAMRAPGEEFAGDGLAFLRKVRGGDRTPISGKAAIIGGGNTAVDVARTLRRLGAEPVIVYRRREQDMPAFGREIAEAVEEGIALMPLNAPVAVEKNGDRLNLVLMKMKVDGTTKSGQARVVPAGEAEQALAVDHVFTAIGQGAEPLWDAPRPDNEETRVLSHAILSLWDRPVIHGGDLTNDIKSVADAIASGKQAAIALDVLFKEGPDAVAERLEACRVGDGQALSFEVYTGGERAARSRAVVEYSAVNTDYFPNADRVDAPDLPAAGRVAGFDEVALPLEKDDAVAEAGRCFHCGICDDCDNCRLFCPELAVSTGKDGRTIDLDYCKGCGICVTECPRSAISIAAE